MSFKRNQFDNLTEKPLEIVKTLKKTFYCDQLPGNFETSTMD